MNIKDKFRRFYKNLRIRRNDATKTFALYCSCIFGLGSFVASLSYALVKNIEKPPAHPELEALGVVFGSITLGSAVGASAAELFIRGTERCKGFFPCFHRVPETEAHLMEEQPHPTQTGSDVHLQRSLSASDIELASSREPESALTALGDDESLRAAGRSLSRGTK